MALKLVTQLLVSDELVHRVITLCPPVRLSFCGTSPTAKYRPDIDLQPTAN